MKTLEKEISIYPTQIKAYIDDSFDFSDQSYQPVGMWDYNEVRFNQYRSMEHLLSYNKPVVPITSVFLNAPQTLNDIPRYKQSMHYVTETTIKQSAQQDKYYIINQNYQDYQTHFKFGLDYRIFSKSAKMIKILKNNHLITITLGV